MTTLNAAITAVAACVPEKELTNADFEKMVDTTDEWIKSRTGIEKRHILEKGLGISELITPCVKDLCRKGNIDPLDIDLLICATVTGDYVFPATANIVCHNVGATNAWGFDLGAACSGFLFALSTGVQFIRSGQYKNVVVVGADKMSSIVDYEDRTTCVLFGDAAGAVLLTPTTDDIGVLDFILSADGSGYKNLIMRAGGSVEPSSVESVEGRRHFVYQEGKHVFKYAVTKMAEVSAKIMEKNSLKSSDVDWLVPHQANLRIIDATARRMGLEQSKVMINIEKYGNTTSATIPLCLWEWEKKLTKGQNLILSAFGGGYTWGAVYVKWAYDSP